jgi:hypothetical protein
MPGFTGVHTVRGLDVHILESYAPQAGKLLDDTQTLVIPQIAYAATSWPYDETLASGRALGTIFGWMVDAFKSEHTKVILKVPLNACELCPLLYACNLFAMLSLRDQIEHVLLNIFRYRPLTVREIMAIWHYHHDTVNPAPGVVYMSLGFQGKDFMLTFGSNVRDITSRQWRDDKTGQFDEERAAYATFMAAHPELCRLMYNPNLHTYIRMLEHKPDRSWSKRRLAEWIEEVRSEYPDGGATTYPMPNIEAQY